MGCFCVPTVDLRSSSLVVVVAGVSVKQLKAASIRLGQCFTAVKYDVKVGPPHTFLFVCVKVGPQLCVSCSCPQVQRPLECARLCASLSTNISPHNAAVLSDAAFICGAAAAHADSSLRKYCALPPYDDTDLYTVLRKSCSA